MNKTKESETLKSIAKLAMLKNYLVIRINSGAVKAKYNGKDRYVRFYTILNSGKSSGLPDLLLLKDDKAILVEVKRRGGRARKSQTEFISKAKNYKITVLVIDKQEDILKYL